MFGSYQASFSGAFTTMCMRSEVLPVQGMRVGHFPVQVQSSPESTVHILQVPKIFGHLLTKMCSVETQFYI